MRHKQLYSRQDAHFAFKTKDTVPLDFDATAPVVAVRTREFFRISSFSNCSAFALRPRSRVFILTISPSSSHSISKTILPFSLSGRSGILGVLAHSQPDIPKPKPLPPPPPPGLPYNAFASSFPPGFPLSPTF